MKKLIVFLALISLGLSASAQRGIYGTIQPFKSFAGTLYNSRGVAKTIDTLANVDTGYARWSMSNDYNYTFDLLITKINGTVAGTSVLQGSLDGTNWDILTGNTTYCSACKGASATVTDGTAHYHWALPLGVTNYQYYQIRTITSGTCTATYTATANIKY